jgi:hypothetical protein
MLPSASASAQQARAKRTNVARQLSVITRTPAIDSHFDRPSLLASGAQ